MNSKQESRPVNNNKNPVSISSELVNEAITAVKKRHYLGASNLKTNPTGGLNGYYRNIAAGLYETYRSGNKKVVAPDIFIYLNSACIAHTGAGNCGELSTSLYLELFCSDLSVEQKKQVSWCMYGTNDSHGANAYIQIASTVYDIWADKQYKSAKLRANTHVAVKKHKIMEGIDVLRKASLNVSMKGMILEKFAKQFDEKIQQDRQLNQIYPTLDNMDKSDFALWATDAFQYLYTKFLETFEDPWYLAHKEVAESIRRKIIKDYLFLIEELRQDIPLHPSVAHFHPARIKYSAEEVSDALTRLVPNAFFVESILAYSYKNTNLKKFLALISGLLESNPQNTRGALETWLANTVQLEFPTGLQCFGEADFRAALLPILSAVKQGIIVNIEVGLQILSCLLPEMRRQDAGQLCKQIITKSIQSEDNRLLKDAYVRQGGSPLFFADVSSEKALEKLGQEAKRSSNKEARATLEHFCLM